MIRRSLPFLVCGVLTWSVASAQPPVSQPPAAPPAASPYRLRPVLRNWTRVEAWSYFEPRPGGGDPDYATIANRLFAGIRQTGPRHELNMGLQYVQFGGLPDDALGPGALGTGAAYYEHNRRTDSRQVYVRTLNLQVRGVLPGLDVRGGRMGYTSGAEAPSGDPAIEAVKRMRLDSRLVGEFEWSIYQRAFDGVRVDWDDRRKLHATLAALWPTQGGFEERAGRSLEDVRVLGATVAARPSPTFPRMELQGFVLGYRDTRPVAARPDNTGRAASAVNVDITTFGASVVGARPVADGRLDWLGWLALQTGDWYDDSHSAVAFALEGGYQWLRWLGHPWVRAGWNHASGDSDGSDGDHDTFFPMLPTGRKYSLSATYAAMNLDDVFAQLVVRPWEDVAVRFDVHHLRLAGSSDLWYGGSGATRREGTIFGYAGRRSGGGRTLGPAVEGSVDWTIAPRWSINGYAGWIRGGDVVRFSFAGDRLVFAYIENVFQF
ncbi:MAG TPA: alginate export family protein [Vicinamibacterales bacterium]|nr:alginate export family protein [Vicinamibacterales bacterium]